MKAYVVTGTTRGIGKAIGDAVMESRDWLFSLSRAAKGRGGLEHHLECDLRDHAALGRNLKKLLQPLPRINIDELVLINNAGILEPMGFLDDASGTGIVDHAMVNLAAPAILMSTFIHHTRNLAVKRQIINISSGAAKHPYSGWAMYCATKAALDMMTLCVAAEQRLCDNPATVCAVYPGKVETGMQRHIRQFDPRKFPSQPEFVSAKESGTLSTAEETAGVLLALHRSGRLKNGGLYDLRSATKRGGEYRIRPFKALDLNRP